MGLRKSRPFFIAYIDPNVEPRSIVFPRRSAYLAKQRGMSSVRKITFLLANRPRMIREVLRELIERQEDMEVVGEALDPVDILMAVREKEPDAIVLALSGSEEPGLCSHLLAEYPNLTILGLRSDGKTAFIRPRRIEIVEPSEQSILYTLRQAIRTPCSLEKEGK